MHLYLAHSSTKRLHAPYDASGSYPKQHVEVCILENNNVTTRPETSGCGSAMGRLPSCAPLANPYVPYQMNNPEKYQPNKGLVRGTLFPGLDLPFMGMVNSKEKSNTLGHQLQSLSFALSELGLYLDTHKDDTEALELFNAYSELQGELMAEYEKSFGPLNLRDAGQGGTWNWVENPWPWEFAANEEA